MIMMIVIIIYHNNNNNNIYNFHSAFSIKHSNVQYSNIVVCVDVVRNYAKLQWLPFYVSKPAFWRELSAVVSTVGDTSSTSQYVSLQIVFSSVIFYINISSRLIVSARVKNGNGNVCLKFA